MEKTNLNNLEVFNKMNLAEYLMVEKNITLE